MSQEAVQMDLGNTEDVITVDDVVQRLKLPQGDAWQLLGALRKTDLLELGPKQREIGRTGRGKQSYRIPKDAAERFAALLKKLEKPSSAGFVVRRRKGAGRGGRSK